MDNPHWIQTSCSARCPTLEDSHVTDVVIVGGGLTGLHAALTLLERNPDQRLTLLEGDEICSDASGRTMGKVTTNHSRIYENLSEKSAQAYTRANKEGFDRIFQLIETYNIECELQRASTYTFASLSNHVDRVRKIFDSMVSGGLDITWIEPRNAESKELPVDFLAGIEQTDQAVYHPRKFALGLLDAIQARGAAVYEHTFVTNLAEDNDGITITTLDGKTIQAQKAIVATRIGISESEPFLNSLTIWRDHIQAYLFNSVPLKNAYIRSKFSVFSFRPNLDYLLLSGIDKEALPFEDEKHYQTIATWALTTYPELKQNTKMHTLEPSSWWGEDADSKDMLPLIGSYRKGSTRAFMAAGFCGWGMTKAAFAGIMLADLVEGKPNPYQESFDPWRF